MLPKNGQYMDFNVSHVDNPFLRFLGMLEVFLTSNDATRRQKRRQFMYDFKKISSFSHLKMANIWISMFSYVENLFLRFLRLFEAFYDATQRQKRHQFMHEFKKITKISSFCHLYMSIYGF